MKVTGEVRLELWAWSNYYSAWFLVDTMFEGYVDSSVLASGYATISGETIFQWSDSNSATCELRIWTDDVAAVLMGEPLGLGSAKNSTTYWRWWTVT
jgi:hypothetical protein